MSFGPKLLCFLCGMAPITHWLQFSAAELTPAGRGRALPLGRRARGDRDDDEIPGQHQEAAPDLLPTGTATRLRRSRVLSPRAIEVCHDLHVRFLLLTNLVNNWRSHV